jgi:hypothetical protein
MVSPPFATTICCSGTPSFFAVSAVIGAPTTGAPVCLATVPIRNEIEMRVRDEDRVGLRHLRRGEADLVRPRRAVEVGVEQIDLALVSEFEIGIAEPPDDDDVGLRRGQRAARHGGLVAVAGFRHIGGERSAGKDRKSGTRKPRQPQGFHDVISLPTVRCG